MALEDSYTGSGAIPINTVLIGPIDADDMRGLALQITAMGPSGACTVQTSMDGVAWVGVQMQNVLGGPHATYLTTTGMFWCNLVGRYLRVSLTAATTSGNVRVLTRLSKDEFSEMGNGVSAVVSSMPAIPAGANLIGSVQANMTAMVGTGVNWSIHRLLVSTATTNATCVKATSGRIGQIRGYNGAAASKFLKLYNKATAPTVGTDVPVLTFILKANSEFVIDVSDLGIFFSNGIAYAFTGAVPDADTTAIAANDIVGLNILYV